jgi:pimeloyl-ACP methyl ester carboxylesterase
MLLPGVKHHPHREAPDRVLAAIADFCRRLVPEAASTARR